MLTRSGNAGRPGVQSRTGGSVLLPVIAAMLILLLAGVALTELFGAQRMQSVLGVESARAFWVAEAGLWHAAHEQTGLSTPVSFDGGQYTVTKSGDDYTATATLNNAARVVSLTLSSSGSGGGSGGTDPLDEAASTATASGDGDEKVTLDLVSISSSDAVITSFSLSADVSTEKLKELKLDDEKIWKEDAGVDLPTGTLTLNEGSTGDRTIPAGQSPTLQVKLKDEPSGTVAYTLVLSFADGTSSTITFSIGW